MTDNELDSHVDHIINNGTEKQREYLLEILDPVDDYSEIKAKHKLAILKMSDEIGGHEFNPEDYEEDDEDDEDDE